MTIPENTGYPIERISEGIYGMSFQKDGETLHLRMEQITKETSRCWTHYTNYLSFLCNSANGFLSKLTSLITKGRVPDYDLIKKYLGYSKTEYEEFVKKLKVANENSNNKVSTVISAAASGFGSMFTLYNPDEEHYIIYVTRNPDFSIAKADQTAYEENFTLKNFVEAYSDLLITVGTDFTAKDFFHTRGISRNPWWIFEQKYSGLSMYLHGFSALVAQNFYPEKKEMQVKALGSMQKIINSKLNPGEGYIEPTKDNPEPMDLTEVKVEANDPQLSRSHIKTSALTRIFNETLSKHSS
jgi:hypothetical protein